MSTTVPPRDGASVPPSGGSALPNEDALRRAFFARYAAVGAQARAALGEDAANLTPKVVEGAFVRAWDARSRLSTPEQLDQFLQSKGAIAPIDLGAKGRSASFSQYFCLFRCSRSS